MADRYRGIAVPMENLALMRFVTMFFLVLLLVPAPPVFAAPPTAPALATPGAQIGSRAPQLKAMLLEKTRPAPGIARGKVRVLNFWATWCPPCRAETADLNVAYAALHDRDVEFLGIDTTESAPIVQTFVSAKSVRYSVALAGAATYNAYGIAYIPTTIVVDAQGIVRARWIGGVSPAQLERFVRAAHAGRSSIDVSAAQAQIDALLAPSRFHFNGNSADRKAAIGALTVALARTDAIAQRNPSTVDYERTQHAQGALRRSAGLALRAGATTSAEQVAALELFARGSGELNRWADAAQADRSALALMPRAPKLVSALSQAYYRLHDYDAMIAQARQYTRIAPNDGDGWSELGLAYQRARRFSAAVPVYDAALRRLRAEAQRKPTQDALADVADTALDAANVDVSLGAVSAARRTFRLANTYGDRLAARGQYATLKRNVKERTQEGLVAVELADRGGRPVVSVAAWTGPDLPGSLASTLKYRVIVAAAADRTIRLEAHGLRRDWVGSFCADGLCSPRTVSFKLPASGVKTYEFQLVPPTDGAQPGPVAIAIGGGSTVPVPQANTSHR